MPKNGPKIWKNEAKFLLGSQIRYVKKQHWHKHTKEEVLKLKNMVNVIF